MPEIEKSKPTSDGQELESVRSDNFVKIYSNSAQIEVSVWDVRIIFGEIVRAGGKVLIEQSVAVAMSPQHAKAMVRILSQNLGEYEKRFGEINVPAEESPKEATKALPPRESHHTHKG